MLTLICVVRSRPCGCGAELVKPRDATPLPNEPEELSKALGHFVKWEDYAPQHLCNLSEVYFVQIGGNCGLNVPRCTAGGDPIYDYATTCDGWQGVVLEPVRATFNQLSRNYSPSNFLGNSTVQPIHGAVTGGTSLKRSSIRMTTARSQASTQNSVIDDEHSTRPSERTMATTLMGLWAELRWPRVDLLVIDVEGHEPRLLADQLLPHPKPRLILFEHKNLKETDRVDAGTTRANRVVTRDGERGTIDRALVEQGYRLVHKLVHRHRNGEPVAFPEDKLYALEDPPACGPGPQTCSLSKPNTVGALRYAAVKNQNGRFGRTRTHARATQARQSNATR